MNGAIPLNRTGAIWSFLLLLAAGLFLREVWLAWPMAQEGTIERVILLYGTLPRGAVACLAGAALGLSGVLLQRVLRNPIADPSTLGVAAGAQLALTAATVYAPVLMGAARETVAFAGGAAALLLILGLSWRHGLDPVTVIICGMLVTLVAGALSAAIILANGEYMMSLFIWGGGSLTQHGWSTTVALLIRLAVAAALAALLIRPLTLLTLDDASARALGLGVNATRLAALAVGVGLATSVTAFVGVIGFVGLAAPNMARLAGARTLRQVLLLSPLIGAIILWLTDGLVQALVLRGGEVIPAGAATAFLGGPLLLWLLPRLRRSARAGLALGTTSRSQRPTSVLLVWTAGAVAVVLLALLVGRGPGGWFLAWGPIFETVAPWRWPRIAGAAAAGAMLGGAGFALQRVTGNPLASPEVLGVGAGAGVGLAAVLLASAGASTAFQLAGALAGSIAALAVVVLFGARHRFAAERLLLAGLAVGALCNAVLTAVIARGGPEGMRLLAWLSGSTAAIDAGDAIRAVLVVALVVPLGVLSRWFVILPLGPEFARAVGLAPARAGAGVVIIAALLTAAATLIVGPLSFVGLIAPHLARRIGLSDPRRQLAGSVLVGIVVMVLADWLARTLAFPYELPTGLFASLVGAPYLVWLLNRGSR